MYWRYKPESQKIGSSIESSRNIGEECYVTKLGMFVDRVEIFFKTLFDIHLPNLSRNKNVAWKVGKRLN